MNKRAKLNTIRIIAGQWRGRRLPVLDVEGLRPTTDRVRETLFNWLMPDIVNARCLDLFAGSGALGLESLSRGADFVQFVESNRSVAQNLQKNVELLLGDSDKKIKSDIKNQNALDFLQNETSTQFDIVFLDPPFQSDVLAASLQLLIDKQWLSQNATVYIEQDSSKPLVDMSPHWNLHRKGKAGQSAYYLFIT